MPGGSCQLGRAWVVRLDCAVSNGQVTSIPWRTPLARVKSYCCWKRETGVDDGDRRRVQLPVVVDELVA